MNVENAKALVDDLLPKQKEELQQHLSKGKNYLHVSKKMKIAANTIRNFDILVNKRNVLTNDGHGKPELRRYVISRRYIDHAWPAGDDEVIQETRREYNQGKVEMVTGRDGFYQLLYRIPRKVVDKKRRPYFDED